LTLGLYQALELHLAVRKADSQTNGYQGITCWRGPV